MGGLTVKRSVTRTGALVLCLVLCLALLPAEVFAAGEVDINLIHFPDKDFRQYVKDCYDRDGNDSLSEEEIAAATYMDLTAYPGIKSLVGIGKLTALQVVYCGGLDLSLSGLDVSKNTALRELYCVNDKLVALDVSNNRELRILQCYNNSLIYLNVDRNTKLQELECSGNKLVKLDLRNNTALRHLGCGGNLLITLDLTHNTALEELLCGDNQLISISLPKSDTLWELSCPDNSNLFELDLTGSTGLKRLFCQKTGIDKVDIHTCPHLVKAYTKGKKSQSQNDVSYVYTENGADYRMFVNPSAQVVSPVKPKVTTQPKTTSAAVGKKVAFKVKASGGWLSYQWYYRKPGSSKWVRIKKATKATYKFTVKKKHNGWKYRCRVKNLAGAVNSRSAKLKVK